MTAGARQWREIQRKSRKARQSKLLAEDCLLDRHQAGALCCISAEKWSRYAEQWPTLRNGARVVRVSPGTSGRLRWLKSAVVEHIQKELLDPERRDA